MFLSSQKGTSVIGPRSNYREFARENGYNYYLNVTDAEWTLEKNMKCLEGVVSRGDDVVFFGRFDPSRNIGGSVLEMEISYLRDNGYKWTQDFTKLIKDDE